MAAKRTVPAALVGVLLMTATLGAACTDGSDDDSAPTTTSTSTIPDDQKPPDLRDSWTPEDLERLAEIAVPDYESEATQLDGTVLTRRFVSDPSLDGVTLTADVRLAPCDPDSCWDLTQEPDDEHLSSLRALLPAIHQRNPDLVYEYGPDELIGDFEAFTLYWRSLVPAEHAYATGYHVLYHDGLNLIEIGVNPIGVPEPADDEMLEAQMPKEWAREVTADVFAAFADEFNADR
ncbi:MAG: hypothetical protein ABI239_07845 [Aquihabitans sp.]